MQPIISVEHVSVTLKGHVVLDDVSAEFSRGISWILGNNGAGKTTLMRLLASSQKLQNGNISILGNDLSSRPQRALAMRRVGYLPQQFGFYPGFRLFEFLEYFALLRGVDARKVKEAVDRSLMYVGLSERRSSRMRTLSGGMIRRAGIAQALVHDPTILVLDEPTAGLDVDQIESVRSLLGELSTSKTIVLSSHHVGDVVTLGGNAILLKSGKVVASGIVEELDFQNEAELSSSDRSHFPILNIGK